NRRENPGVRARKEEMLRELESKGKRPPRLTGKLGPDFGTVSRSYDELQRETCSREPGGNANLAAFKTHQRLNGAARLRERGVDHSKLTLPQRLAEFRKLRVAELSGRKKLTSILEELKAEFPEEKLDEPAAQLEAVEWWLDYQAMGGTRAYLRLGG